MKKETADLMVSIIFTLTEKYRLQSEKFGDNAPTLTDGLVLVICWQFCSLNIIVFFVYCNINHFPMLGGKKTVLEVKVFLRTNVPFSE